MGNKRIQPTCVFAGVAALLVTVAVSGKDRFTVVAANGIAFSEFRGYDTCQPVAPSQTDGGLKVIVRVTHKALNGKMTDALLEALKSAAAARGIHEKELGGPDPDRPQWYAEHMARTLNSKEVL